MHTTLPARIGCWLLFAFAPWQCIAALGQLTMLVPYQPQVDYSYAVWQAVESARKNDTNFPFNAVGIPYDGNVELADHLKQALTNYPLQPVLILGPGTSGEAAYLDQVMTNLNPEVLFVSPSVTTKGSYTNLKHFVRACLPDDVRIDYLGRLAPNTWGEMSAAFIGRTNTWGQQLYQNLAARTNIAKTLSRHLVHAEGGKEADAEYESIARQCSQQKIQVLFVGLEEASAVRSFLRESRKQSTFWVPYKPMICLLGDYRFISAPIDDPNLDPDLIPNSWANELSITMLSEAFPGIEGPELYQRLAADLLGILSALKANKPPFKFTQDVEQVFNSPHSSDLLNSVSFQASYFFLNLKNSSQYPCSLKWLGRANSVVPGARQWLPVQEGLVYFWFDLLRTRIFWIGNLWLIFIALAALAGGLALEIRKRYIYVQTTPMSLFSRVAAWGLITSILFGALLFLSWTELLNSANFTAIFLTCLSPMAVLPMLQHGAFTKFPYMRAVLEPSTVAVEVAIDMTINSRAIPLRKRHAAEIVQDLKDMTDGSPPHQESTLWHWWYQELREISGEGTARKVYERWFTKIKVWDKDFKDQSRIEALVEALAYTRVVNRKPLKKMEPAEQVT